MRTKTGTVVSDKMEKTITIVVHSYRVDKKYKKRYRISKKFYAHDPEKTYKMNDKVTIYESRPLSRLKRWTVIPPHNTTTS